MDWKLVVRQAAALVTYLIMFVVLVVWVLIALPMMVLSAIEWFAAALIRTGKKLDAATTWTLLRPSGKPRAWALCWLRVGNRLFVLQDNAYRRIKQWSE